MNIHSSRLNTFNNDNLIHIFFFDPIISEAEKSDSQDHYPSQMKIEKKKSPRAL